MRMVATRSYGLEIAYRFYDGLFLRWSEDAGVQCDLLPF